MYGQIVKNLMFGQDVLTYQKLKGLFGSFGKALDTASLAELRRYTPEEGQGPNTISVMVFDGIPVDIAFSMVTKKGNRDARYGRLVFARTDGDEARIFWVTYFDQEGALQVSGGVAIDMTKTERFDIFYRRLWELLDIRFDEVENFNEIVTERG